MKDQNNNNPQNQNSAKQSTENKAKLGSENDPNEANRKGAVNTSPSGTQPTASQQQGQGLKSAKNPDSRSGSESGGSDTNKKDR
ncbi:hypothetical protein [Pontibacter arcticus]|uniref:Uncharacterized protein n=1 Tax=Pontibacter arcticus TaxID=2080288 RepID=A0A364RH52_9BACT|nr:hypothetical protein [Pontibacter arcticus]RAU83597.1 hypothetical protein DP923_00520 [Pontibacter arcticus]